MKLGRFFALITIFFGLILLSLFHVKRLDLGWYEALKWAELLGLLIYLKATFQEYNQFLISAWIIFVSATLQSLIALWQFHVQHMIGLGWLGEYIAPLGTSGLATIDTTAGKIIRAYGTMPHPNILAAFLIFGLLMGFLIGLKGERRGARFLVSCGTILITLGIFVTFSRLAWLATGLAYVCFIIYQLWRKNTQKTLILAIIGLVSCGTILFGYHSFLKARVTDANQTTITDRGFFNHLGLTLVSQHPLFGVGVGNYIPALQGLSKVEPWQYQPAHNIFIFIAAESGIVGLIIFLWILLEIFRGLKNVSHGPLLLTTYYLLLTFLFLGQFDHYFVTIQQGRLMFFTVLGLVAALPNLSHEKLN